MSPKAVKISKEHREKIKNGDNNVPCGKCNSCCWVEGRELELPIIDWGRYQQYELDDKIYLSRKRDLDPDETSYACSYFDDGCTIYEDRPYACRIFDCRDWLDEPNLFKEIRICAENILDKGN